MKLGNPLIPTEISALRKLNARASASTLNLGLGQPEIDMPEALRDLAAKTLHAHRLGYTPNAGRADLREAIAAFYGLSVEGLLVSHGAQEGLMAVLLALLRTGDEVLVPDPGFLAYPTMVKIAGGRAKPYSLKNKTGFGYDVERILSAITRRTRAVLLCSPNNPTGTMITEKDRARLIRELERRKIFLISDDVYAELAFRDAYQPLSSISPFAITVSSWSKSLALTGWRIGFVHTEHAELGKKILAAHQYLTTCASAPAQALLLETLQRPKLYQKILQEFRETYEKRLKRLHSMLPYGAAELASGGFYLFLRAPGRSDTAIVESLLKEKNLLLVPGSFFGKLGRGHLRVSVAADEKTLEKAGKILNQVYRSN